jgi:hypothetical protein
VKATRKTIQREKKKSELAPSSFWRMTGKETVYLKKFALQEIEPRHLSSAESDHHLGSRVWEGKAPSLMSLVGRGRLARRSILILAIHPSLEFLEPIRANPKQSTNTCEPKRLWLESVRLVLNPMQVTKDGVSLGAGITILWQRG